MSEGVGEWVSGGGCFISRVEHVDHVESVEVESGGVGEGVTVTKPRQIARDWTPFGTRDGTSSQKILCDH